MNYSANTLIELLSDTSARVAIVVTVVSALAVVIANRIRRRAPLRHTILLGALAGCLACPLAAMTLYWASLDLLTISVLALQVPQTMSAAEPERPAAAVADQDRNRTVPAAVGVSSNESSPEDSRMLQESLSPGDSAAAITSPSHQRLSIRQILAGLWLTGVVLLLLKLLRNRLLLRRMVGASRPVRSDLIARVAESAASEIGLRSVPEIVSSSAIGGPAVVGVREMIVLVPDHLTNEFDESQLLAVLVHEFAHIYRRDPWILMLQQVATCLYWPIPSIHWLNHVLSQTREEICDNHVVEKVDPIEYGTLLLKLAECVVRNRDIAPSIGMLQWRGKLEDRIAALVDPENENATTSPRSVVSLLVIVLMLFCVAGAGVRILQVTPQPEMSADASQIRRRQLVTLLDHKGVPVVGAEIYPQQLRFLDENEESATIYNARVWDGAFSRMHVTDSNGKAELEYPARIDDERSSTVQQLRCRISHEDHVTRFREVPIGEAASITLPPEVYVRANVRLPDGAIPESNVFAQTNGPLTKTSFEEGTLRIGPLDLNESPASTLMRVVHAPEAGAASFSRLIDLSELTVDVNQKPEINVTLKHGVSLSGRISADVSRPVVNGHVVAVVNEGADYDNAWNWAETATVDADGTFRVPPLPPDTPIQLLAICDGWISAQPDLKSFRRAEEVFDRQLFANRPTPSQTTGDLYPQLLQPDQLSSRVVVSMEPTADARVVVRDAVGDPVSDAVVAFYPNQKFYGSTKSAILGGRSSTLAKIRAMQLPADERDARLRELSSAEIAEFRMTTDNDGIAVVRNLPANSSWYEDGGDESQFTPFIGFTVEKAGYSLQPGKPERIKSSSGRPMEYIDLISGRQNTKKVRMVYALRMPPIRVSAGPDLSPTADITASR